MTFDSTLKEKKKKKRKEHDFCLTRKTKHYLLLDLKVNQGKFYLLFYRGE